MENSERTFAIIKPDAVEKMALGKIITKIEENGFNIVAAKLVAMTHEKAADFYRTHEGKPFYEPLLNFMSSGKSMVMVLEAEDAIAKWRALLGVTDSQQAEPGTIRNLYGTNSRRNACHGSDAPETAQKEIEFFFKEFELL